MYREYKTFKEAVDRSEKILVEETGMLSLDNSTLNLSAVADVLIRDSGRFAEHYASDMLYGWEQVKKLTAPRVVETPENHVICFGIRKMGVDGNTNILKALKQTQRKRGDYVSAESKYRRILAVGISIVPPADGGTAARISAQVKNITASVYKLAEEDEDL